MYGFQSLFSRPPYRLSRTLRLFRRASRAWKARKYRSALDWVIDQYQVSEDKRSGIVSDPNRADDPQYIVRLVCRVVTVSIETVRLVRELGRDVNIGEFEQEANIPVANAE